MRLVGVTKGYRAWTTAEVEAVRLCDRCCDRRILAAHLNRSVEAVRYKVRRLGLYPEFITKSVSKTRYKTMVREESARMQIDSRPVLYGNKRLMYALVRARVYTRLIDKYTMISIGRAAGKHHTTVLYALRQLSELESAYARKQHVATQRGNTNGPT